jgi:hypothetical protein
MLENPELIENFAGKSDSGVQDLWNKISGTTKTSVNSTNNQYRGSMEVLPEDGDLGTDFTSVEKPGPPKIKKPNERELPEIAVSIDETPDYYSAVNIYFW